MILYGAVAIHNAKKDNDYPLPDSTSKVIIFLLIFAIYLASREKIVFIGIVVLFILGILYNLVSRYIVAGDATIIAFSHIAWPMFISSTILGLSKNYKFVFPIIMYVIFWFLLHLKNLKDTIGDKKRGYKTITTNFKNGREITLVSSQISYIFMIIFFFVFNFKYKLIFSLILLFVSLSVFIKIKIEDDIYVANLLKFSMILFFSMLIFEFSGFSLIFGICFFQVSTYIIHFIKLADFTFSFPKSIHNTIEKFKLKIQSRRYF